MAMYVAVEREFDGYDPSSVVGKPLAAAVEQLDAACERLGVATLSSFVSADPAELQQFASDEPPLTRREAEEQLAALRKLEGSDERLADELEALMNEAFSDAPVGEPLPEQWFEPEAGLAAVRALLAWLQKPGSRLSAKPFSRRDVIADLRSVEEVLSAAARAGVRFHLAFDV